MTNSSPAGRSTSVSSQPEVHPAILVYRITPPGKPGGVLCLQSLVTAWPGGGRPGRRESMRGGCAAGWPPVASIPATPPEPTHADISLITIPPPRMGARMKAGKMNGSGVGGPWNAKAMAGGPGYTAHQHPAPRAACPSLPASGPGGPEALPAAFENGGGTFVSRILSPAGRPADQRSFL